MLLNMKQILKNTRSLPLALIIATLFFNGACTPVRKSIQVGETAGVRLPFVRALIDDSREISTIGADGAIAIECLRGSERFVYFSPRSVRLRADYSDVSLLNSSGDVIEGGLESVTISSRNAKQLLSVDGKPYRGMMRVGASSSSLTLVNILYIEDYLKGVVPPEIGPVTEDDFEAIKAQAVAARTYTMSHLGQYGEKDYDVASDVSDQVYSGASSEKDLISRAVIRTTGEVARYNGAFITAYYHSTCGGRTDYIENVWEKGAAPYLVSVSCDEMCAPSKYYNWSETYSGAELAQRVSEFESSAQDKKIKYQKLTDISVDNTSPLTPSPGLRNQVTQFTLDGIKLSYLRDRVRWVVRRASDPNRILQSDYFVLDNITRNPDGSIRTVTIQGKGYGHGVGMCQMGALGMARSGRGFTHRQILERYYRGITIDQLY
jgi:stage II sporulation protein D